MKSAVAFGVIGLGFLLLLLSGLWSTLFPPTRTWTEEKAARLSEMQTRIHNLAGLVNNPNARPSMHSGEDLGAAKLEYEQLKRDSAVLFADFQSAYNSPRTVSSILKWSGISLAVAGLIGWYAVNNLNR